MNKRLVLWAITSALAGLLFGFDTVVISGAESKIQQLWSLSGTMHGLAISAALWGTVLGAIFGGIPTAKYGRKKVLIGNGLLFLMGAAGTAFAWDVWSFFIFRFIGGIGIGISTIAAPLFISEISPAQHRGKLTGLFQFNIVFGILLAFFSNFVILSLAPEEIAWRWMLGIQLVPAALYTLLCFTLPESPRWLITQAHNRAEGKRIFALVNPEMDEHGIEMLVQSVERSAHAQSIQDAASANLGLVSKLILVCMIVFIAAHAVGSGTIIWVFISEIFPNEFRASGQALGSATHWIFAAGLTLLFPIALAHFDPGYIFAFFCLMMVLQLLWCRLMMPETKGRSLEEISRELAAD